MFKHGIRGGHSPLLRADGAVKRDEIADKPEVFVSELKSLLGEEAKIINPKLGM